jgi:excinuclease ABC subunit A
MSPLARKTKKNYKNILKTFLKEGFIRARINGEIQEIASIYEKLSTKKTYTIEIVIDRIIKKENIYDRLIQSIELAYKVGDGSLLINDGVKDIFFSEKSYCFKDDIYYEPSCSKDKKKL